MIKSRYSVTLHAIAWLTCAFMLFVITITLRSYFKTGNMGGLFAAMVMALMTFVPICLFGINPRISFTDSSVQIKYFFRTREYDWKDATEIYLSTRASFILQPEEATSVTFYDGYKLVIREKYYANSAEMRQFLEQKLPGIIKDPPTNLKTTNLQFITTKKYAGNPFLSGPVLTVVGTIILMIVLFSRADQLKGPLYILPIFLFVLYLIGIRDMNYFIVDNGYLIIKNHFLPGKTTKVDLRDIKEIAIERPYRRPTGLRVIQKDLSSKLYCAGSLTSKIWDELVKDMNDIGIPNQNSNEP